MTSATPYDPGAGLSPYQAGGIPAAPAGTSPSTPHIWAIVWLFTLLNIAAIVQLATIDWNGYMNASMDAALSTNLAGYGTMYSYILTPAYFAVLVATFLVYAATVLLAYFDATALQARGVQRPFPWALSFIPSYGSLVYVIGRSVVVRRRTGSGLAPLVAYIVSFVLTMILTLVVTFGAVASMMSSFPSYNY